MPFDKNTDQIGLEFKSNYKNSKYEQKQRKKTSLQNHQYQIPNMRKNSQKKNNYQTQKIHISQSHKTIQQSTRRKQRSTVWFCKTRSGFGFRKRKPKAD